MFMYLGIYLNNKGIFNYIHFQHVLYFSFYIWIGKMICDYWALIKKYIFVSPYIYATIIVFGYIFHFHFPNISGFYIDFGIELIPLQILLSILGTLSVFYFCQKKKNRIILFLGEYSLGIYIIHSFILFCIMDMMITFFIPQNRIEALLFHICALVGTIICSILCILLLKKYTPYLIGKIR